MLSKVLKLIETNDQYNPILKDVVNLIYVREVESFIAENYSKQLFRCPVHLSIGQEAVAVGICANLGVKDKILSTHRSHAHYLAKGGSLFRMFAELMGSIHGCCNGRGGSMHLLDTEVGMMGSIPIVGSTLPIACGLGFAEKKNRTGNIVVAFVGDAVYETGSFYESLNIMKLFQLPILIVIEDNEYSTYAPKSIRQTKSLDIASIASGFGIDLITVNGDNLFEVKELSSSFLSTGEEHLPRIVLAKTFRRYEHCGPNIDDNAGYRDLAEIESYSLRDPVMHALKVSNLTADFQSFLNVTIKNFILSEFNKALETLNESEKFSDPIYSMKYLP